MQFITRSITSYSWKSWKFPELHVPANCHESQRKIMIQKKDIYNFFTRIWSNIFKEIFRK